MNVFRPPGSSTLPRFRPVNTRKRARTVAIVLASCTVLGVGAWTFGVNPNGDWKTECQRDEYVAPVPDGTIVNVYNGSGIGGLGAKISADLQTRGFTTGKIENDPLARKIRGTGELRYGDLAANTNIVPGSATLVTILDALRSWQPGMVLVNDHRKGADVDFVTGATFSSLRDVAEPPPGTPKGACKPQPAN